MPKSFIENINALANATALATGDIVADTQVAAEEAVISASNANNSAVLAEENQLLAKDWANKGHNSPVTLTNGNPDYSAYHWKTEAQLLVDNPIIQDLIESTSTSWSSTKIVAELNNRSAVGHTHNGVYEPVITKNTAFNREFTATGGDLGVTNTVSRGDHTHSSVYEPIVGAKGTAFNKNFGTTSGTIAEGSHLHTDVYMPKVDTQSAYNKSFVVDTNTPLADEIPRGNHIHKSSSITYDSSSAELITSTTVAGALDQLDLVVAAVEQAEKCKLTAGMTDAFYTVDIISVNTPVVINAGMTTSILSKNALYSNGIQIDYDVAPTKLVEGQFSGSVTVAQVANKAYAAHITKNGVVIDNAFKVELGEATKTTTGAFTIPISGWISGLENNDVVGIALSNMTDNTDIIIYGMTMSFAGQPEGALVASGITVSHDDVLSRDAIQQHPTASIYETGNIGTSLDTLLAGKAHLVPIPTNDNIVAMDATGDIKDSGITTSQINNHMDKVATPTLDNIVTMATDGQSKNSGTKVSDLANVDGSGTQVFNVANSVLDTHAINQAQLNANLTVLGTKQELIDHTNLSNPHNTTHSDVGAAATVHTHAISDVTSLQDTLNNKYTKVTTPVTNNIPTFAAGDVLQDSGVAVSDLSLSANYVKAIGNINSPILDLPLQNDLSMKAGVGEVTFSRATTATYIDRYGVLQTAEVDGPRFEKDGLLIEGTSTNELTYSEDISNAVWVKSLLTIGTDTTLAPDGVTTAQKLETDTSPDAVHYLRNNDSLEDGNTYSGAKTLSVFAKAAEYTIISLAFVSETGVQNVCWFDLANGVNLTTDNDVDNARIEDVGDGWYRCSVTYTFTALGSGASASTGQTRIYMSNVDASNVATGTPTAGDGVYIFGFQVEELPFATSYIPTTTTVVTRGKDITYVSGSKNIPSLHLGASMFVDVIYKNQANNARLFTVLFSDLSSIRPYVNSTGLATMFIVDKNAVASSLSANMSLQENLLHRIGWTFDSDGIITCYIDGNPAGSTTKDISGISYNDILNIMIGTRSEVNSSEDIEANIKNIRIWNRPLTATEASLA